MSPTSSPRQPGGAARHAAANKVHRDSHNIHKDKASSPPPPRQQPVIIYTHSPKVIRTSPRDFMSIVQKLTGLDSPGAARNNNAAAEQDESSSSSPHHYADPLLMQPPAPPLDALFVAPDMPLFPPGPSELQLCVPTGLCDYQLSPPVDAAPPLGTVMMPATMKNGGGGAGNSGAVFSPSMVEEMRTTFPNY
jgi:hypothetical protein